MVSRQIFCVVGAVSRGTVQTNRADFREQVFTSVINFPSVLHTKKKIFVSMFARICFEMVRCEISLGRLLARGRHAGGMRYGLVASVSFPGKLTLGTIEPPNRDRCTRAPVGRGRSNAPMSAPNTRW